jgi:hypothetical protein
MREPGRVRSQLPVCRSIFREPTVVGVQVHVTKVLEPCPLERCDRLDECRFIVTACTCSGAVATALQEREVTTPPHDRQLADGIRIRRHGCHRNGDSDQQGEEV